MEVKKYCEEQDSSRILSCREFTKITHVSHASRFKSKRQKRSATGSFSSQKNLHYMSPPANIPEIAWNVWTTHLFDWWGKLFADPRPHLLFHSRFPQYCLIPPSQVHCPAYILRYDSPDIIENSIIDCHRQAGFLIQFYFFPAYGTPCQSKQLATMWHRKAKPNVSKSGIERHATYPSSSSLGSFNLTSSCGRSGHNKSPRMRSAGCLRDSGLSFKHPDHL